MGDGSVADAQDIERAIEVNSAILDLTGIFSLLEFSLLMANTSFVIAMLIRWQCCSLWSRYGRCK
jgi:hypothetical protein